MTKARICLTAVLLTVGASSLISCSALAPQQPAQATPPAQTTTPAPQAAAPSAAQIPPTGLGSNQYSANPDIRCDLLEVKRVSGNALLARWRMVNTGAAPIYYDFNWNDFYFIDPAENKKYGYLTDAEGSRILEIKHGTIKPGEQWLSWAKFPAPPPTSTKISMSIGGFAPFEDVPVTP